MQTVLLALERKQETGGQAEAGDGRASGSRRREGKRKQETGGQAEAGDWRASGRSRPIFLFPLPGATSLSSCGSSFYKVTPLPSLQELPRL